MSLDGSVDTSRGTNEAKLISVGNNPLIDSALPEDFRSKLSSTEKNYMGLQDQGFSVQDLTIVGQRSPDFNVKVIDRFEGEQLRIIVRRAIGCSGLEGKPVIFKFQESEFKPAVLVISAKDYYAMSDKDIPKGETREDVFFKKIKQEYSSQSGDLGPLIENPAKLKAPPKLKV